MKALVHRERRSGRGTSYRVPKDRFEATQDKKPDGREAESNSGEIRLSEDPEGGASGLRKCTRRSTLSIHGVFFLRVR